MEQQSWLTPLNVNGNGLETKKNRRLPIVAKKAHTLKIEVLSTTDKRIKYLSCCYHGSTHDFTLLKEELSHDEGDWFKDSKVYLDLGYQGITNRCE